MSMSTARIQLVSAQPFYGAVLQNCLFSWNESIKTAGVGIDNKGRVNLVVARSFWDSLSEEHRVGLLMHESLHLLMDHNVGAHRNKGMDRDLANYAEDIAINQFIPPELLPPGALLPDQFGFDHGLAFEEYYLLLLEQKQEMQQQQTLDNHNFEFGDGAGADDETTDSESKGQSKKSLKAKQGGPQDDSQETSPDQSSNVMSRELQAAVIQDLINKAMLQVGPGNVPNHVKSMLPDHAKHAAKIRWSNFLRKYMGRYLSNEVTSTRTRPNRRLGFSAQGSKREHAPKCMFGFDESGSMSDDDLLSVANESRHILKTQSDKAEVVHFDTEIALVEKLSKIKTIERHANGGTDFTPLVERANSQGVDLLIICSDGDGPMRVKPKMPVIWIMPVKGRNNHAGEKIYLKG